ncbi:MAG: hypothetical protein QM533_10595 [Cytophagales bacterium]|nr:hypothetical protein [Cytophagales bacterium]
MMVSLLQGLNFAGTAKYSAAAVSSAGAETYLQVNVTDSAGTVQSAPLRAAVYLDTADLTDANNRFDPSLNKQWYLQDASVIAARPRGDWLASHACPQAANDVAYRQAD